MSFVIASPDLLTAAAADLAGIGSRVSGASAVAAAPTSSMFAAGADEVSGAVAALFSAYGQEYQALNAQAVAFHQQFVDLMTGGAAAYASAEAANTTPLDFINSPFLALLGRPLIGDGAAGITNAQGFGTNGGAGGLLWGNGGNGGDSTAAGVAGGAGGVAGFIGNGGRGGAGGPGGSILGPSVIGPPGAPITPGPLVLTVLSGGAGGAGGSAVFFGNGGGGGMGGLAGPFVGDNPGIAGFGGHGGSAGYFGGGGAGGPGGIGGIGGRGGDGGLGILFGDGGPGGNGGAGIEGGEGGTGGSAFFGTKGADGAHG
jgi:hypothetical protein